MTLGARIAALRAERKLSQGDLAEKLNVSRQSVSKWETDTSVPELDKLILLSELFGVTIDELVKEEAPQRKVPVPEADRSQPAAQKPSGTQKTVGFILLGAGLVGFLLGVLFSRILLGLGIYLALAGTLLLLVKRYAGLILAWVTVALVFLLCPVYTGVGLLALYPPSRSNGHSVLNTMPLLILIALLLLIGVTAWVLRKRNK